MIGVLLAAAMTVTSPAAAYAGALTPDDRREIIKQEMGYIPMPETDHPYTGVKTRFMLQPGKDTVVIHLGDVRLVDALSVLADQENFTIKAKPGVDLEQRIGGADFVNVKWVTAMQELAKKAGADIRLNMQDQTIEVVAVGPQKGRAVIVGGK